ncbi:uncharacterized protein LOC115481433 [Microcaecilia unicolor]|uniref:Uncharacterized protein LOC115481433 n=1 Tax=Microcaecilia unicolor TaxID=1415580 RepID=A0A6P7ZAR0_9AMPH|nr:uncharacterized protein LOC115481433 [Microcaecilia unicolor]XP_030076412.1 uncharacterized protein LOC115481433 [Microcaecilia unicolor]XP_030076422.1 uncharacterized protein LOC115481433 [Microcaecilia unicolor]
MELGMRSGLVLMLTLTIALNLQSANGKTFISYLGENCIDKCMISGSQFKCEIKSDDQFNYHYCSPQQGVDYQGRACKVDHPCDKHGLNYFWCYVKDGSPLNSWGYCGFIRDDFNHITSTYSLPCKDECSKRNDMYFWCETGKKWDYCSPAQNVDYKGERCKSDHPCGKYGESYTWCHLEKGSWDKCGLVELKIVSHRTSKYGAICLGECRKEGTDYFWCETVRGWDKCSPLPDVTYKNVPCRADHSCDLHGQSYYWCYTDDSWDYCGPVEENECAYERVSTRKRAISEFVLICHDTGNQRETHFLVDNTDDLIEAGSFEYEAQLMIAHWNNGLLLPQSRSQILISDEGHLRLDLQGFTNTGGIRHRNYQIQINEQRRPGTSTSIAQVLIPDNVDLPERYIRRAFVESMHRRARIIIRVQPFCREQQPYC